jgi:hypothetical protein
MPVIKRLFKFYINSSIHVAIAVVCLTGLTFLEFNVNINKDLLFFTFFATITGYNFVKYYGMAKFYHRSLSKWLKEIQLFSFFSFIAMLYSAFSLSMKALLIILGLALLTFLYTIPFFSKNYIDKNTKNLRAISGLKIYIIAMVWAITVVLFPLVEANYTIDNDVVITLIQRFLFVIIIMLPFEIRDMKSDSLKLLTIPQQIGIKRTKQIGIFLLIIVFMLECFKDELVLNSVYTLGVVCLITLLFLIRSNINQGKYYSAFWVESIPVFWVLMHLILF